MPITILHGDHNDRVDGRELHCPDEPGSDDLLLRGLLLYLAKHRLEERQKSGREP
jgi:hypothetical protein